MRNIVIAIGFILMTGSGPLQALVDISQDKRVLKIYEESPEKLVWFKNGEWTVCAKSLMEVLSKVDEEGLWPEDYIPYLDEIKKNELKTDEQKKSADQLLTYLVLNYISDMKGERLKPHLINKNIHVRDVSIDETEFLKKHAFLSDDCSWISSLSPDTSEYKHLKEALALYREKHKKGSWPLLPIGTKLEKGDQGPDVAILREQLIDQDGLEPEKSSSEVFDDDLEAAVKKFQGLHGLEEDGKIGVTTLAELNTPVDQRIKSIIVNMEQRRWLPSPLPSRYVEAMIPAFYLRAVSNGKMEFYMPIITGKEYRKTPVFNALMTGVTFNPSWHVPQSIIGEILPKMNSNPEAYARKGYYMSGGRLIQRPGNGNSLGKIKFEIDSPYGIYLHGTPSVNLFKKAKRAFSHGCIRVEDPYKLANFVLNDSEAWTLTRVRTNASGTSTKSVKLPAPVPTFITYSTVYEDENQQMHFVSDEYGLEKEIWKALEKAKRTKE